MLFQPLLAEGGDILGLIVWAVIIGVSVLSKIIGAAKKGQPQKPPARRPAQPPRAHAPPAQRPGGRPIGGGIESEIEDFLNQARGGGAKPPPQPDLPPPGGVRPRIVQAVSVEEDIVPGENFGRGLREHVAEHIGQDSISTRDAQLGDTVEAADEKIEDHLNQVFNHDVGHLAHVESVDSSVADGTDAVSWEPTNDDGPTAADKIRNMLKTPESVRDVFIVSEILKRPEL